MADSIMNTYIEGVDVTKRSGHITSTAITGSFTMTLTTHFEDTVVKRAQEDLTFRDGLLTAALEYFLDRDPTTGKLLLCNYIDATIGF